MTQVTIERELLAGLVASCEAYRRELKDYQPCDYEKAGRAAIQSAPAQATPDKQTPFANCKFQICDLPGQCRGEGKCHHPVDANKKVEGWKLVPVEPTLKMSVAFAERFYAERRAIDDHDISDWYAELLAAAPKEQT